MTTLLIFTACGSNNKRVEDHSPKSEVKELDRNITLHPNHKVSKTVTIYVHGYRKGGYAEEKTYGERYTNTFTRNLLKFTGDPSFKDYNENNYSNVITAIDFYGDTAPNYFTQEDIEDIEKATQKYGGGIPRYALIVAKFSKYILKKTGAEHINIVSVSMGSLITRWMIEKDIEHLASEKKIEKWITIQGIIRGNYALSNFEDDNTFLNLFFEDSAETKHMKYQWIEKNLSEDRSILKNSLYQNILVGQISLTNGSKSNSLLKYVLPFYGGFQPNDGIQIVKDTYFEAVDKNSSQVLSYTLIHHDHIDVKHSEGVFANIATFLKRKKRVRITLLNVTVNDIHEEIDEDNVGSEIIFESRVYSPKGAEKWDLNKAIDERIYESGALKVYNYYENGQNFQLNQILFDTFLFKDEKELNIKIEGYEIDNSTYYDIKEVSIDSQIDSLGASGSKIQLKNGTYKVTGEDWEGEIKVEVIE